MKNINKLIKNNQEEIKQYVKNILSLTILYDEVHNKIKTNQETILSHFNFKNSYSRDEEPEFIKKASLDYMLNDNDFKIYFDLLRILNLKSNLYTSNINHGADLVLKSQIIENEKKILNLFFDEKKYISSETKNKFIEIIKNLFVNQELEENTKKFKIFGSCEWEEDFIKDFSQEYKEKQEVLNFLSLNGFNELQEVL
jgi:hypothetical protein